MFFVDGSVYSYGIPFELPMVRAIGWLDRDHEYSHGDVREEFVAKLWKIIETRTRSFDLHANVIRGIHPCDFCGEGIFRERRDGCRTMLGMSELWVPFGSGWLAAPTLIVHYVELHSYLPPNNFIEAVMNVDTNATINAQVAFESLCAPLMEQLYSPKLSK
jgi:hypothetical protein